MPRDDRDRDEAGGATRFVEDVVAKAVAEAYYPDRVRAATAARTRAQAAQSAVTAFAGALVATFTFTALADQSYLVRISGCVAVCLWLAASIGYVAALALPTPPEPLDRVDDVASLIKTVLARAQKEAAHVDRRQRYAHILSAGALLGTGLAFVGSVLGIGPPPTDRATLTLDPAGTRLVREACGAELATVTGELVESTLPSQFVALDVAEGDCPAAADGELLIPRGVVQLIRKEE